MWQHLALRSLGVIDEAELELDAGFTVITGETGAGKTMVVTALGLLRGDRADPGVVRHGAEQARVEAEIAVAPEAPLREAVEAAGGEVDSAIVLARSVSTRGRSRAHAGGASVPAGLLTQVTDELVTVHGQADQHRLVRPAQQRTALDRFAGPPMAEALARYRPAYQRWREIERQLIELRTRADERRREADDLRQALDAIAAVEPVPGEDAALRAEESRLAHAESLALAAERAHGLLAGDVTSGDEAPAASDLVATAASVLADAGVHDPALAALASRAREAAIVVADLGTDVAAYAADVDLDPARLETVHARLADLQALSRRHGPTVDDVLAWAQAQAPRLLELDGDDDTLKELTTEHDQVGATVQAVAAELSALRRAGALRLGQAVDAELAELSMASAHLTVEVRVPEQAEPGPHGMDEVEFLFAANSGSGPRPLARGASGGELSRLMLAIEVVLADRGSVPTMVFDEVDAGIGGRAAVEVGRRLARLAEHVQVIAVTHLPQVAAFAAHHFRVLKDDDGSVTKSSVVRLDDTARVDELARMLAGQEDSASARAHARELLDLARSSISAPASG